MTQNLINTFHVNFCSSFSATRVIKTNNNSGQLTSVTSLVTLLVSLLTAKTLT